MGFDNTTAMPQIYSQGGDFAVATLIATQYGLAVLNRAGQDPTEKTPRSARIAWLVPGPPASCCRTARPATITSRQVTLDKGVTALLIFRGAGDVQRQGQGSTALELTATCVRLAPKRAAPR